MMGFSISLTWENLLYCMAGCFVGQLVGVLPGIGAPTAVALLLPLTFSVNPTSAIIMFAGIYYGVAYGGTITSVLINVPVAKSPSHKPSSNHPWRREALTKPLNT